MSRIANFYRENINGIIITLVVHILVFSLLYLSQLKIHDTVKETEILIDFSQITPALEQQKPSDQPANEMAREANNVSGNVKMQTNRASNRLASSKSSSNDQQLDQELADARNLLKDVNRQLNKEIPTIEDLKMPNAPPAKPEDMKGNYYKGESNIEYYLENRFHQRLPIPVYLAQGGGKVKVDIIVDRTGRVLKAEPVIEPSLSEQILSYAKTAALQTLFNADNNAPSQQKGYIIYNFIPQK